MSCVKSSFKMEDKSENARAHEGRACASVDQQEVMILYLVKLNER